MKLAWRIAVFIAPLGAVSFPLVACSSDDAVGTQGADAGSDSAVDSTAPADTGAAQDAGSDTSSGSCPAYTGTDPVCTSAIDLCTRCSVTYSACGQDHFVHTCDDTAKTMSDGLRQIEVSCAKSVSCASVGLGGVSKCVKQQSDTLQPTAAHTKIAQDFCSTCLPTDTTCASSFFTKADGGAGPGRLFLLYSDELVNEMDSKCVPLGAAAGADAGDAGPTACDSAFGLCVYKTVQAATPPNPCADGG